MTRSIPVSRRMLWGGMLGLVIFLLFLFQDPSLRQGANMIPMEQAIQQATAFWHDQEPGLRIAESHASLASDTTPDGYLGQQDLRDKFLAVAPSNTPLTYWSVTLRGQADGSLAGRTYKASVDPVSGRVVAFSSTGSGHGGQAISQAEASTRALEQARRLAFDTTRWEFISAENNANADARLMDLSWRDKSFQVEGMALHYHATFEADRLTAFSYSYSVPDSYIDWHDTQVAIGGILTMVSLGLTFGLFVLALIFVFVHKGPRPWRGALWLAGLTLVLFLFSNLNTLSAFEQDWIGPAAGGDMARLVTQAILVLLVIVLSVLVGAATLPMLLNGGQLVQDVNPRLWTSWKSPDWRLMMKKAVWQGYLLAFLWLALQGIFYWFGETFFGVWYENDVGLSPANAWWPALFPLMGWMAGVQEEIVYRLFGVTFFKRYWKSTVLAVVLPAMIWALGHSLYPIYPIYTRFIELTLFGALIGICYLRYGIETVIFAHAIFDIIQMAIPLLTSGEMSWIASGLFFLVSPIIVGTLLLYLQKYVKVEKQTGELV